MSCQSSPYQAYQDLPVGAEKGQVLHRLGNPQRTYRKNSTDHWVYSFKEDGIHYQNEVWFQDGRVISKDNGRTALEKQGQTPNAVYVPVD